MLIVGLTGGVASGKTEVSQVFKKEGAYIIDADQIARELVQPHRPAWNELIREFGKDILQEDGSLHRKKLAAKVFVDPEQRELLNQILHHRMTEEMDRRIERIREKDPEAIVVIDAPLLIELGYHHKMDKLVVVASTEGQQVQRLRERDGIGPQEARRILSSQISVQEKVKLADFVIRNEGSLEETKTRAKEIFRELKKVVFEKKRHSGQSIRKDKGKKL
jgi:dephospho-CoA kinase